MESDEYKDRYGHSEVKFADFGVRVLKIVARCGKHDQQPPHIAEVLAAAKELGLIK